MLPLILVLALAQPSGPEQRQAAIQRARARALQAQVEALEERLSEKAKSASKDQRALYSAALVHLELWKLKRLTQAKEGLTPTIVPSAHRAELRARLVRLDDRLARLAKRLAVLGREPRGTVDLEERQTAERLGIGRDIGQWSFAREHTVRLARARLVCQGETPFWGPISRFAFRPPLKKGARALYQEALQSAKRAKAPLVGFIEQQGECLIFIGQPREAITLWQRFLQAQAAALSAEDFARLNGKVEALLGSDAAAKAYRKALEACAPELHGMMIDQASRAARAGGVGGLDEMVDSVERKCGRTTYGASFKGAVYFHAARAAHHLGDHEALGRYLRRARALGPAFAKPIEASFF